MAQTASVVAQIFAGFLTATDTGVSRARRGATGGAIRAFRWRRFRRLTSSRRTCRSTIVEKSSGGEVSAGAGLFGPGEGIC